ncbi:neprilysin-1-like [Ixodes scapularis]|uniref:neprilysin-1-like n=1 Tax=Ixodes scapularis TaxID=6945 RepID=UPI001A9E3D77|nr:neprilysin-1-like [Ixodes scapularis]
MRRANMHLQTLMRLTTLVWVLSVLNTGRSILTYTSDNDKVCQSQECRNMAKQITDAIDTKVDPCADFFSYACGKWKESTQIPRGISAVNRFAEAANRRDQKMGQLLKQLTYTRGDQSIDHKLGILFRKCTEKHSGDKELSELKRLFKEKFGKWPKKVEYKPKRVESTDLLKTVGFLGLLGITVDINVNDNSKYAIVMKTPSSDPLSWQGLQALTAQQKTVYREYIERMITTIDPAFKDAQNVAKSTFDFEGDLSFMRSAQQDSMKSTTLGTIDNDLKSTMIKYKELIKKEFSTLKKTVSLTDSQIIIVESTAYHAKVENALKDNEQDELYNFLGYKYLSQLTKFSKSNLFFDYTRFMKTVDPTYNEPQEPDFTSLCMRDLMVTMKHALGQLYVKNFFKDQRIRDEVMEITTKVKEAVKTLVDKTWLQVATRKAAQNKVDQMSISVGYPEWLLQTSEITALFKYVPPLDEKKSLYVTMVKSVLENNRVINLEKLTSSVDKTKEWSRDAADVNGEYKPITNSFMLYAGVLQEPLYSYQIPIAASLGSSGFFGGHELTHGFDSKGREFDATGKLSKWWTPQDIAEFTKNAQCFVSQYSDIYDAEAEERLSGTRTEVENIADNGAISAILLALGKILETTPRADVKLPGHENRSPQELLFLAYANTMCNKMTKEARRYYLQQNPHSLPMHRVNVPLQNHQEFADAFKCKSPKKMIPPKRCTLW